MDPSIGTKAANDIFLVNIGIEDEYLLISKNENGYWVDTSHDHYRVYKNGFPVLEQEFQLEQKDFLGFLDIYFMFPKMRSIRLIR